MKTVYRAENIIDAHLVKNALEQNGIRAFVMGEFLAGAIGELPARDLIKVQVAESDFEAAEPIAREIETAMATPLADDESEEDEGTDSGAGDSGAGDSGVGESGLGNSAWPDPIGGVA
ncbi:MAG: DUF2007 domain-containing protein [Dokdonella sp.]